MRKHVENATESKETKKWLLSTVNPSLKLFSKLPNHVLMSLVLTHLNGKELHRLPRVSKSFSGLVREFKKTASAQKNLDQFLQLELRALAQKQKIELKEMPTPEALSAIEQVVEIKSSALVSRARSRQSTVYEYAISILCTIMRGSGGAGGDGVNCTRREPLSPRCVNVLRVLFVILCAASIFGLYREIDSGKQDDDTHYLEGICGTTAGVTGIALLIDIVQSLYNCSQQREVNEEKSQVSFLRNMHSSIYSSGNYSSINSDYKALRNG